MRRRSLAFGQKGDKYGRIAFLFESKNHSIAKGNKAK